MNSLIFKGKLQRGFLISAGITFMAIFSWIIEIQCSDENCRDVSGNELVYGIGGLLRSSDLAISGFAGESVISGPGWSDRGKGLPVEPSWIGEGDQYDCAYGFRVAGAGDVNGDGYSEVIVGAPDYTTGEERDGKAFLYHGSVSGLSEAAEWTGTGTGFRARYGYSVSSAGDVNGDGYDDVLVGSHNYLNRGGAFIYHGSAGGLTGTAGCVLTGSHIDCQFGICVSSAGDVNNDGFDDVIIGARTYTNGEQWEGAAFLYYGSATGISATGGWSAESDQAEAFYGTCVSGAGDVNDDGYDDIIVGAPDYENQCYWEGRAYVYHGSATGPASSPDWIADGEQALAHMGWSAAGAGDVNNDGYADVILGVWGYDQEYAHEGRTLVYYGSSSGLGTIPSINYGGQASAYFGFAVDGAGDVDGDGFDDVIIGAYGHDQNFTNDGRAYVFTGAESGLQNTPSWIVTGEQTHSYFGLHLSSAGDVNGDDKDDVIVGSYGYNVERVEEGRAYAYYSNDEPTPTGIPDIPAMGRSGRLTMLIIFGFFLVLFSRLNAVRKQT